MCQWMWVSGCFATVWSIPKGHQCAQTYFKFDYFRPGQLEAILPALHGRDVFVRIPTGGGKSLCFFIVPLSHGPATLGVIISPLIGLMDEQVHIHVHMLCTRGV